MYCMIEQNPVFKSLYRPRPIGILRYQLMIHYQLHIDRTIRILNKGFQSPQGFPVAALYPCNPVMDFLISVDRNNKSEISV